MSFGIVKLNGATPEFVPDSVDDYRRMLARFVDKRIDLRAVTPKRGRSNWQNRYYWGVVIELIADHCGYFETTEKEGVHEHLKRLILGGDGGKLNLTKSTADLSTAEFEDYLSKCRIWASRELGVYIPEPNED